MMSLSGLARCAMIVLPVVLTGCGGPPGIEQHLAASGFDRVDLGARQQLASLAPLRLTAMTLPAGTIYAYADPTGCRCVYMGTPVAFSFYSGQVLGAATSQRGTAGSPILFPEIKIPARPQL